MMLPCLPSVYITLQQFILNSSCGSGDMLSGATVWECGMGYPCDLSYYVEAFIVSYERQAKCRSGFKTQSAHSDNILCS